MNIIKIITTKDCYGCDVVKNIIKKHINDDIFNNINVKIIDYKEDLDFVKKNNINDFLAIVFIKNNNIIARFISSVSWNKLLEYIKTLF